MHVMGLNPRWRRDPLQSRSYVASILRWTSKYPSFKIHCCCCIQHACTMQRHAYAARLQQTQQALAPFTADATCMLAPSLTYCTKHSTQLFKPSRKNVRGCKWRDLAEKEQCRCRCSFSFFSLSHSIFPTRSCFCGVSPCLYPFCLSGVHQSFFYSP